MPHVNDVGGFYAANMALIKGYPKSKENDVFLNSLFDELEKVLHV